MALERKHKVAILCTVIPAIAAIVAALITTYGGKEDKPVIGDNPIKPPISAVLQTQEQDEQSAALVTQPPVDPNMAVVSVNPASDSATIRLLNGNVLTGTRSVVDGTTLFTFYTDGSTASIRLQVPDNMVMVCTDDATIETMDARGLSFIQSRQSNLSEYFTKAYGGAVVNLTNYSGGKLDIWCSAN